MARQPDRKAEMTSPVISKAKSPALSGERSPATDTCPGGRCQGKSLLNQEKISPRYAGRNDKVEKIRCFEQERPQTAPALFICGCLASAGVFLYAYLGLLSNLF